MKEGVLPRLKHNIWGILAFVALAIPVVLIEVNIPTFSDYALTKGAIESFIERDTLDGQYPLLKSWYSHPRVVEEGISLHYPLFVYGMGVIGVLLLGQAAYVVFPLLFLAGIVFYVRNTVWVVFDRLRLSSDSQVRTAAWLIALAALAYSWIYIYRFELVFMFFAWTALYYTARFMEVPRTSFLVLATLSAVGIMLVKQNFLPYGLVFLAVLIGVTLWRALDTTQWRRGVTYLALIGCIVGMAVGPIYGQLIARTGTISYYSASGYPVLDETIFSPKYLQYQGIDKTLRHTLPNEAMYQNITKGFERQYPSLQAVIWDGANLTNTEPRNFLHRIYLMYWEIQRNLFMNNLLALSVVGVAGVLLWRRGRSMAVLYTVLWFAVGGMAFVFTINPRYLMLHFVLLALASALTAGWILPRTHPRFVFAATVLAFASLTTSAAHAYTDRLERFAGSSLWAEGGLERMTRDIQTHTEKDARIFTAFEREIALSTDREALWDMRWWFLEDQRLIERSMNELYQADYVLLRERQIRAREDITGPFHVPKDSAAYQWIQAEGGDVVKRWGNVTLYTLTETP